MSFSALITEFFINLFTAILSSVFGADSFLGGTDISSLVTALLTRSG